MIAAGKLRHVVTLKRKTQTADGLGGFADSWATLATARAELWTVGGSERQMAAQNHAVLTHRCRIRSYAGLTTADIVVLGSRSFNILFINDVEFRNREMVLDLEEIVGREADS